LIAIGQMFHFKKFFPIYICDNSFSSCGPSQPLGTIICTSLICTVSESFHVNLSYSGSVVLKEKIFQWPHQFFTFLWLSPLWRGTGPLFVQFTISFTHEWFVPSLHEIGLLVLEKISFSINTCKYSFPYCGPSRPWLEQTSIYIMSESIHVNPSSSGSVVLEKIF
jgi:hypothetical protein